MPTFTENRTLTVALVGNPNTGKSTLFSGLVGVHQHVGNYPGVTVEKKTGQVSFAGRRFELIDLPGLYSLAARSRDEMVVVDVLLGRQSDVAAVDAILCIVDASNLPRNLYLIGQVLELGLPAVLAVNMVDVAERHGIRIDLPRLEKQLGIPVVAIQANKRVGLSDLKTVLARVTTEAAERSAQSSDADHSQATETPLPECFEQEAAQLEADLNRLRSPESRLPRSLVRRLLLDANGYLQQTILSDADGRWARQIEAARERLRAADCPIPGIETSTRYAWVRHMLDGVVSEPAHYKPSTTDRIDRVLTHRWLGTAVFAVIMLLMFNAVFVWAAPAMELIQAGKAALGDWVTAHMAEGALRSLLVDGVVNGVGSVFQFLPQIFVLFAFLAVLEDCGYMARAAYLMDYLMSCVGLSGKSFIPLLSSFACAVPGIMATRVIENERDRLTTILVAPLLTCSARLPVYTLLISAFIPAWKFLGILTLQGLTLAALYLLGIVAAVVFAMIFKRTVLRGQTPPFVMELPTYKWPSPRTVVYRMVERGWVFVRCAGTLILAVAILVWAALYYPHDSKLTHQEQQRQSYLGQAGRLIEPAVKPLGWDWRIGCAVLASLPAREIVVATMGVMYHVDDEPNAGEDSDSAQERWNQRLHSITWDGTDRPVFTVPVALSIMVFFALCAQCAGTLAVIQRETNSWKWPIFTFSYMTALAYVAALFTYQVGTWIGG